MTLFLQVSHRANFWVEGSSFVVLFSQDVQFELFGGKNSKKSILRKGLVGFYQVPMGKRLEKIFSRTRQESSHQTFSQDALFGLFGGQKAQIGRLEKIEPPNLFSRCSFWTFWPPKNSNWTSWENKRTKLWLLRRGRLESRSGHSRLDCTFFGEFCV